MTLTLEIPEGAAAEKRLRLAVALYDLQAISQGAAAEMAGISRSDFLDALGRHGISPFHYSPEETLAEASRP